MVEPEDHAPLLPTPFFAGGRFVVAPTITLISIHYYEQEYYSL